MADFGRHYIGSYRVLRLLRSSQTCNIYEGLHETHNLRVALKVLKREHVRNRHERVLLKHEFMVAKDLDHPRVIKHYDYGVHDRLPCLALEFFCVRNMKQAVQTGLGELIYYAPKIVRQSAEGLEYFHSENWIHRDVKPDNYLLDEHGNVKLIDFSLAQSKKTGMFARMFVRSRIQGTRSYMSPEQIRGKRVDVRADIYSFGCTMFHLIAGKPPFTAFSANELLSKHLKAPVPSLAAMNSNIAPEFAQLLQKTMAKRPAARFQSVREFLTEFAHVKMFRVDPPPPADQQAGMSAES